MRLGTVLTPVSDENLQLAAQCGVTDLVARYTDLKVRGLQTIQRQAETFGLIVPVVEGYLPIERLKVGGDDGTDLAAMKDLLKEMGDAGVRLLCYNFMAGTDWVRTQMDVPERGGARATAFRLRDVEQAVSLNSSTTVTAAGRVSAEQLWENLERFLNELLPVAERAGVDLAMHPDDPPLPELLGRARIMNSVESFERLINLAPSPAQWDLLLPGLVCDDERRHPGGYPPAGAADQVRPLSGRGRHARRLPGDFSRQRPDRYGCGDAGISRNRLRRDAPARSCAAICRRRGRTGLHHAGPAVRLGVYSGPHAGDRGSMNLRSPALPSD